MTNTKNKATSIPFEHQKKIITSTTTKLTTSMRYVLWTLDEEVPSSVPSRTNLEMN